MTDEPADTRPAAAREDGGDGAPRLGRRLLVLRASLAAAAVTAAPAARALEPTPVQYRTGITDSDPSDGPGYGRGYRGRARTGLTDADPSDGPGYGRGVTRRRRAYTGINDGDPNDPSGYGTGWRRAGRPYTGLTDADPSDGAGHGRGGYRPRSVTDSDPSDAPGRGRGWR